VVDSSREGRRWKAFVIGMVLALERTWGEGENKVSLEKSVFWQF
jgi:hypothetical protein